MTDMNDIDDACITCGEIPANEETVVDRCPNAKRPCGHHCNCIWIHDECHRCPAHVNDDGELVAS